MSRPDTNTRLLIGTLLVASTLTIMVDTAISPALPAIEHHFTSIDNASFWAQFVLVLPSLFVAFGAPIIGVLIDRIGRKPVLSVSAVLYGLAGGAGFVLNTLSTLLVSRALLGIGAAGVFVTATTLISDYFPSEERRDTIFGWQGAFTTFGGVVFLLIGGVLASFGWRVPFLIYACTLVLVPLIVLVLYEPERADNASGTLAEDESIQQLLERIPLGTLALIYAIALIGSAVFFLVPVEVPFYVTRVVNAGSVLTGLAVATTALFAALTSTQYTRIRDRLDVVPIVALMFGLIGVGLGIVSFGYTVWVILLGLAVTGVGVGFLVPNTNAWIAVDVTRNLRFLVGSRELRSRERSRGCAWSRVRGVNERTLLRTVHFPVDQFAAQCVARPPIDVPHRGGRLNWPQHRLCYTHVAGTREESAQRKTPV